MDYSCDDAKEKKKEKRKRKEKEKVKSIHFSPIILNPSIDIESSFKIRHLPYENP